MTTRYQRGWLRKIIRKQGPVWQYRYNVQIEDQRKERTEILGSVIDFPREADAWKEVDRRGLLTKINEPGDCAKLRFRRIAQFYLDRKIPRMAPTTQYCYRHIINDYLIPRWGDSFAVDIKPLEVEEWLYSLSKEERDDGLEWPTLSKMKCVFVAVFQLAEKFDKIPADSLYIKFRDQLEIPSRSDYTAVILSPEQTSTILRLLPEPYRTMTVLTAATGLRYSELAGLHGRMWTGSPTKSISAARG